MEWIPAIVKPEHTAKGTFCLIERNGKLYPETCYYFGKHQQDFCPDGNEDWADFENDEYYLPEGWYTLCDQCEKYWKVDVSFYMIGFEYPDSHSTVSEHSSATEIIESKELAVSFTRHIIEMPGDQLISKSLPDHYDEFIKDKADREIIDLVCNSQSPSEFDTLQEGDWFIGTEEEYYSVLKMFAPNELVNNHNAKKALHIGFICAKESRYTDRIILSFDEDNKKTRLTATEFLRRAENTFKNR